MAITRAQQAKQMLQDGGMLVSPSKDGKRPGYRSARAQSGRTGGASRTGGSSARERGAERSRSSNRSSTSKTSSTGFGGGDDRREQESVTQTRTGTVKTSKTGPRTKVSQDTRDRQRKRYNQQFLSRGQLPPVGSRPTSFTDKLKRRREQGILDFINRDLLTDLTRFEEEPRDGFFGSYPAPSIYDEISDAIAARKDLSNIKEFANLTPIGKSGTSFEMSAVPDLDIDSIRELASTRTTLQGQPLTSYQANLLSDIRQGIKNRDELVEQGMTQDRFEELYPGPTPAPDKDSDPCLGPNPPAYCFIGKKADDTMAAAPPIVPMFRFMNRGGMVEDAPMGTGIMDLESARQMMFIGGVAKAIGKGLKSATRAAKKVFKSPFGKAALLAAPFVMGGGGGGLFSGLKGKLLGVAGAAGTPGIGSKAGLLKDLGLIKGGFGEFGGLTAGGIGSLFGITSLLAALQKPKEDENFDLENYYEKEGLSDFLANLGQRNRFLAEGGKAEPVAKKTMPLLDLDGKEMDFRAEGGFVPIGRMEKADDVPARLSKNEFVFTAEAVRNAGDGDVDKGAEVMYNTMKNLEAGGTMSEESQGQDGAKEMFQTAQRLEGVM
jgi:hypothetical protein